MKRSRPIVAIDGPVGAGKSTVARGLARALGFDYLNTGAMYRALALAAHEAGIDPDGAESDARMASLLKTVEIALDSERVMLNGRDVGARLKEPAITDLASRLSTLAAVRARMRELQRAAGAAGGVVMEGRDIGTVVFPDAEFKFFLDASPEERARRRYQELADSGVATSYREVLEQLAERDRRDRERELAPLKRAPGAILIDSTGVDAQAVVSRMKARVQAGRGARKGLKQIKPGCKDR